MKKNIYLIIMGISLCALICITIFIKPKEEKTKDEVIAEKVEEVKKTTKEKIETLEDKNLTYETFSETIGTKTMNINIAVGKDSYLLNKPESKIIKKYNLQKYVSLQKELASKVEDKYLNNLNYKLGEVTIDGDEYCQLVTVSGYYYALYLNDLLDLTNSLSSGTLEDAATNEKVSVDHYKSKVIAMKVLDNHLDDYDNKTKESYTGRVCYKNGELSDENQMLNLVSVLNGESYENANYSIQDNLDKAQARLKQYLQEATNITIN